MVIYNYEKTVFYFSVPLVSLISKSAGLHQDNGRQTCSRFNFAQVRQVHISLPTKLLGMAQKYLSPTAWDGSWVVLWHREFSLMHSGIKKYYCAEISVYCDQCHAQFNKNVFCTVKHIVRQCGFFGKFVPRKKRCNACRHRRERNYSMNTCPVLSLLFTPAGAKIPYVVRVLHHTVKPTIMNSIWPVNSLVIQ